MPSNPNSIRREAEHAGLSDTIIVNSCAVTHEAVAQARQSIRRLKRARPGARVVVTGCAAQTQPELFADMAEVDRVVGNDDKMRSETWRAARAAFERSPGFGVGQSEKIAVADIMAVREMAPHLLDGFKAGLPRVFVQVQNGCDHRCTFCIIPYGRGNSRSVADGAVVEQVRTLVERGHAEIVLTGVDLTSYGADLPGAPTARPFGRQILRRVPELTRLRTLVDRPGRDRRDLLDMLADEPRLMPHLHLSLQSGDDLILKRMKRRHSRADAVALCAEVRRRRPDTTFGADLIAGFPTETENMFARSQSGRGVRSDVSARVSLFAAPGHAGGANASGPAGCHPASRKVGYRQPARRPAAAARFRARRHPERADRKRHAGPHRTFSAGDDCRRNAGRGAPAKNYRT